MSTKLTLTIEKSVIEKAKTYARKSERSLSDLIENYLRILTREDKNPQVELSANLKSMKGAFKLPKDFDYKENLTEELSKKYL